MSDDKKILKTLKAMPVHHLSSESKNNILKSIREEESNHVKNRSKMKTAKRVSFGMAACVLAAAVVLAVFNPSVNGYISRLFNSNNQGQSQTVPQGNETNPTPASEDETNTSLNRESGPDLMSIKMIDDMNGWSATSKNIMRTTNGGATWVDVTPPSVTGNIRASFFEANYAWAATSDDLNSPLYIYSTMNGGKDWVKAEPPEKGFPNMQIIDNKNGWLWVSQGVAMHHEEIAILKTTDNGLSWTTVSKTDTQSGDKPGKLPFSGDKTGMVFSDNNTGWMTGEIPMDGYLYFYNTKDGGKTWYAKELPIPENLKNSYFVTQKPVFFSSTDGVLPVQVSGDTMQFIFYITHDGGNSWACGNTVNASADQPFIYDFTDRNTGFGSNGQYMYTTLDGGFTWQNKKPNISLNGVTMLDFISSKTGYALLDGTLFKTTDGGSTWSQIGIGPLRAPGVSESRTGAPLPYSPSVPVKQPQKPEDAANELMTLYFDHYSDSSVSEIDRLKSYTVNNVELLNNDSQKSIFSVDYTLQGVIDANSWTMDNYAYAGDGQVKNGMFYICIKNDGGQYSLVSISKNPPLF